MSEGLICTAQAACRVIECIRIKTNGRLLTSHRYNRLPLLSSDPGGVQQELVVQDLPAQR